MMGFSVGSVVFGLLGLIISDLAVIAVDGYRSHGGQRRLIPWLVVEEGCARWLHIFGSRSSLTKR